MNLFSHRKIILASASKHLILVLLLNCIPVFAQSNDDANMAKNLLLPYQSVLGDYQSYKEQPVGSWRGANDEVQKIGGWRVYAREANETSEASQPDAPNDPKVLDKPGALPANTGNNVPRERP